MAIRRISRTRTAPEAAPVAGKTKRQLIESLKSIAKIQATIEQLQKNLTPQIDQLQADMVKAKLVFLDCDDATADIVRSAGKSQVTINPKKFYAKVAEEDFFACCTIGVTKAKAVMGQKELDRISTTVPGKPGEPKLKVTRKA